MRCISAKDVCISWCTNEGLDRWQKKEVCNRHCIKSTGEERQEIEKSSIVIDVRGLGDKNSSTLSKMIRNGTSFQKSSVSIKEDLRAQTCSTPVGTIWNSVRARSRIFLQSKEVVKLGLINSPTDVIKSLFVSTPTHNQVSNDTPQHQCTLPVFLCAPAPTMILRVDDRVRGSSPLLKRSHPTFDRRETG